MYFTEMSGFFLKIWMKISLILFIRYIETLLDESPLTTCKNFNFPLQHTTCETNQTLIIDPAKFPDIHLVSDSGKKFPTHKIILSSNSDFFDLLFQSPMIESQNSEIPVREIPDEILEKIILSCYPNKSFAINSKHELHELLAYADQFQMPLLKSSLLQLLCSHSIGEEDPEELLSYLKGYNVASEAEKKVVAKWFVMNWDYSEIEELIQPFLSFFGDYFDLSEFPEF